MKPWRLLLLTLFAAPRIAGAFPSDGIVNLSWDECGKGPVQDTKVFACDTNVGSHTLIGSYTLFTSADSANGNEIVVDVQSVTPTTPAWWQLRNFTDGTVGCRNGSTAISFDFTAPGAICFDYWKGQAIGGWGLIRNYMGALNRQRLLAVNAIPLTLARSLSADIETYSYRLVISNTKTVDPGSCGGCGDQVLLMPVSITVTQNPGVFRPGYPDPSLRCETVGTYARWSPQVVATRNTTWGAIKSMYR